MTQKSISMILKKGSYNFAERGGIFMDNKKEGSMSFMMIQVTVCVIIIILAVLLKLVDRNTFFKIRNFYNYKLNEKITIGEDKRDCEEVIKSFFLQSSETKNRDFINRTSGVTAPYTDFSMSLGTPVEDGVVTSQFGIRDDPITGAKKNHSGLDIAANKNSQIYNVMPGTVEKVEEDNSYGKYVIIDHGNEIKTLYAHCEKILASQNEEVSRGQPIALVGSTGKSTGDHVHFEIMVNDIKYDPEPLLNL